MLKLFSATLVLGFVTVAFSTPSFAGQYTVNWTMKEHGRDVCGRMTVNWENPPRSNC